MQDPLFICAICGWSTTRKSSYTKHFNTCTDPAKKLKIQNNLCCSCNISDPEGVGRALNAYTTCNNRFTLFYICTK